MIQLRIKDESDLYSPFDPNQVRISDGVYYYLKSFCTEIESKKHLHDTLQIISDGPVDGEKFKRAIDAAVKREQDEFDRQISLNRKRAKWEYIVGIALSAAGFLLPFLLDQVLLALISFLGTMIIREAVMVSTKVNPDIKRLSKLLDPFRDFRLEIVVKNDADAG